MKKLSVSVVIPNLNGEKLLEKNLPSVLKAKENPNNNITEIIIVDDGSWDGSVKLISKNFPQVKLIKHKINRGFSAGVNTGVRMAKGDLVVLLNTDVVPSEDFLEPIFKHFENKRVFAVSMHEDGFSYAKGYFGAGYIQLAMGEESSGAHPSFYVSGGSGVFRRSIWMELGAMDEKLLSPFYWEDIDICYRAEKRGYLNLWEPESHVIHNHESTIGKFPKTYVQRVKERNQLLVIWKNIHSPKLMRDHIIGIIRRTVKHPGYVRIILMAVSKIGVAMKARRKEMKLDTVSDEAVFMQYK